MQSCLGDLVDFILQLGSGFFWTKTPFLCVFVNEIIVFRSFQNSFSTQKHVVSCFGGLFCQSKTYSIKAQNPIWEKEEKVMGVEVMTTDFESGDGNFSLELRASAFCKYTDEC